MWKISFIFTNHVWCESWSYMTCFFVADFNLLSCKFDNFTFALWYLVLFILIPNKFAKQVCSTFPFPCEKFRMVSLIMIMKNVLFPACFRCPLKLICCIAFGFASRTCFCLDLLQSTCNFLWNMDNQTSNQLCYHLLDL